VDGEAVRKFSIELLSMVHDEKGNLHQVSSKGSKTGPGAIQYFQWWLV